MLNGEEKQEKQHKPTYPRNKHKKKKKTMKDSRRRDILANAPVPVRKKREARESYERKHAPNQREWNM